VKPVTFSNFAEQWYATYPDNKGLKRSTRIGYRQILDLHLISAFGELRLELLDLDCLDRYMASKRGKVGPASINRHLNLLNLILKRAIKRGALAPNANPVPLVDRPKEPRRRWAILTPAEIVRTANAFSELAAEAAACPPARVHSQPEIDPQLRVAWLEQSRVIFLVSIACGMRRGELLGLRWRHVDLVDMVIRVEETWVRAHLETPKSEAGERTISLSQVIAVFRTPRANRVQRRRRARVLPPADRQTGGPPVPGAPQGSARPGKGDEEDAPVPGRQAYVDHE